ncbi:MAG: glycosyltransferase [Sumerlaeia bacterium]
MPPPALNRPELRILHIDTEKGFRGGEGQVMALMRGLRARAETGEPIRQLLAARRGGELARRAGAEGFDVLEVPPWRLWDPRAEWAVHRLAHYEGYILHAHTGAGHALALKASRGRSDVVVTRRVDFPIKTNWASRRKYGAGNLHYIAISEAIAAELRAGGVAPERITLVPSGVDPGRFVLAGDARAAVRERLRAAWGVEEPGPVIGTVGAYVDHKDPLNLIEAVPALIERLPGARVVFVGEGELRPDMETRIAALGLGERVRLTGWREDVAEHLAAFDLFVLPSKLEGLGTALLDAMAVGLPCVAARTGGIPDIVRDGENGVLVPPRAPGPLAEALAALWQDPARREAFAQAGPATVRERFSTGRMVEGTLAVYRRVESAGS